MTCGHPTLQINDDGDCCDCGARVIVLAESLVCPQAFVERALAAPRTCGACDEYMRPGFCDACDALNPCD